MIQIQYFFANQRKLYICLTHAYWFRHIELGSFNNAIEQLDLSRLVLLTVLRC